MTSSSLRIGLMLGLLTAIAPLSIDMYLPAMPEMEHDLNASIGTVQLTLTAFMIGLGLSQIIYGPISDQIGRKPPVFIGLGLFIAATAVAYQAPTAEILIAARFAQGIGGSVVMVIPRAVIRDLHTGPEAMKLMGIVMMVIAVSPMFAPLAGSAVLAIGDWRTVFLTLIILAVLAAALVFFAIPETLSVQNRKVLSLRNFGSGLATLFKDPEFMLYTMIGSFGMASLFVFVAGGAFVYMDSFGLSESQFAMAFAVNGLGFFITSMLGAKAAERFGAHRMIKLCILAFLLFIGALALLAYSGLATLTLTVLFLFLGYSSLGLVIPSTVVLSLENHGEIAGLASSLGGVLRFLTAGIVIGVASQFMGANLLPMVLAIFACGAMAMLFTAALLFRQSQVAA